MWNTFTIYPFSADYYTIFIINIPKQEYALKFQVRSYFELDRKSYYIQITITFVIVKRTRILSKTNHV